MRWMNVCMYLMYVHTYVCVYVCMCNLHIGLMGVPLCILLRLFQKFDQVPRQFTKYKVPESIVLCSDVPPPVNLALSGKVGDECGRLVWKRNRQFFCRTCLGAFLANFLPQWLGQSWKYWNLWNILNIESKMENGNTTFKERICCYCKVQARLLAAVPVRPPAWRPQAVSH